MDPSELLEQFEHLPLRRDAVAFLGYIGDRELKLTTKKNLTLKDVRAINDLMVKPGELDERIGDRVYVLRSEEHAQYIFWLRTVLLEARLLKIRYGKISQTKAAKKFVLRPPLEQTAELFDVWWNRLNWSYFSIHYDCAEDLQWRRVQLGWALLAIPAGEQVELKAWANDQLEYYGLIPEDRDEHYWNPVCSHWVVARALIRPLDYFGAVVTRTVPIFGSHERLESFRVTDLGRYFLSQQTARFGPPPDRGN